MYSHFSLNTKFCQLLFAGLQCEERDLVEARKDAKPCAYLGSTCSEILPVPSTHTIRRTSVISFSTMSNGEDTGLVPLQDQRVFGAGHKRKRIILVPPSASSEANAAPPSHTAFSAAQRYLSIVFQDVSDASLTGPQTSKLIVLDESETQSSLPSLSEAPGTFCEICCSPQTIPSTTDFADTKARTIHTASIAHQYCLAHSQPPSHLNRQHIGVKYLLSHGWDPDARLGLGASSQGITAPVKGTVKNDTVGVGAGVGPLKAGSQPKQKRLNARAVREMDRQDRKKREQLEDLYYASDDALRHFNQRLS